MKYLSVFLAPLEVDVEIRLREDNRNSIQNTTIPQIGQ